MLRLVLDTNVVLDWLVFRDRCIDGLQRSLDEHRVSILTHVPALDELRRVLTYPQCKLTADAQTALLHLYQSHSSQFSLPVGFALDNLLLPAGFPSCKDGDDQHFLALAYHAQADALVSKDRQVLKLRRRARNFGVTILDPRQLQERLAATDAV